MDTENKGSYRRVPYKIGRRVPTSFTNQEGYEHIDVADIPRDKPILLAISGNGAISDQEANGMAREVYGFLGVKPKDNYIDMYSISYGVSKGKPIGNILPDEIQELAENILVPRVMSQDGGRLPLRQVCKNLRQINVVSYCFGQEIINRMATYTENIMLYNLGYQEDEVEASMRQILNVCYAPYSESNRLITNINYKSLYDDTRHENYIKDFTNGKSRDIAIDELNITSDGLRVTYNTLDIFANNFSGYKKNFENILQGISQLDEHAFNVIIGRDSSWYNNNSDFADIYSRCFALAISAGVVNSRQNQQSERYIPLPRAEVFEDLIKSVFNEPKSQNLFEENNNYRQKINEEQEKQ